MTANQTLPAVTYRESKQNDVGLQGSEDLPTTTPGPVINGRSTSITLMSPSQLVKHDLLHSFNGMCNAAYRAVHIRTGILPPSLPRLPQEDSILTSVGTAHGSFTYVIHYTGTNDVVGTISMRKYLSIPAAVDAKDDDKLKPGKTFERELPVPDDMEAWEAKLLTVGLDAQGQGLAALLMKLGEAEARRRFETGSPATNGLSIPRRLLYVLSSIKEEYYAFYLRRGYSFDYEVSFPVGTLGSEKPFTIVHMSKHLHPEA